MVDIVEIYLETGDFHEAVKQSGLPTHIAHLKLIKSGCLKIQDKIQYGSRTAKLGGMAEELFQKYVPDATDANKYFKKNNPVYDFWLDGQIELTDEVIATVVGGAATEIFGVVGMASKNALKDNFQALLGKENYAKGVVVKAAEDGSIAVDVYTVLSYGTKISEVSKNIQESVRFSLENQLGITAQTVNVYIQNIKVVGE